MFFDSLSSLLRVIVVGLCAYVTLLVAPRLSGKRMPAEMNAFDLVVTVALAEGALGLVLLIAAQYAVAWTSVRWKPLLAAVKSTPTLLV